MECSCPWQRLRTGREFSKVMPLVDRREGWRRRQKVGSFTSVGGGLNSRRNDRYVGSDRMLVQVFRSDGRRIRGQERVRDTGSSYSGRIGHGIRIWLRSVGCFDHRKMLERGNVAATEVMSNDETDSLMGSA